MKSPCILKCKLKDSVCIGCHRTKEQIGLWSFYDDEERIAIMKKLPYGWMGLCLESSKPDIIYTGDELDDSM